MIIYNRIELKTGEDIEKALLYMLSEKRKTVLDKSQLGRNLYIMPDGEERIGFLVYVTSLEDNKVRLIQQQEYRLDGLVALAGMVRGDIKEAIIPDSYMRKGSIYVVNKLEQVDGCYRYMFSGKDDFTSSIVYGGK